MGDDTIFRISSMTKPVVAVAAMVLVEDCRLRLDEPVDDHLPELADRRVLVDADGPLDDTVPADRSITARDLLTFSAGYGQPFTVAPGAPYAGAMEDPAICTGPPAPGGNAEPDEWLRRMGEIPLVHQPGAGWRYHVSADLLGMLVARAAGQPLEVVLRERVFEPLGMADTAFSAADALDRFGAAYDGAPDGDGLVVWDPADGQWSTPPAFPSAAGGLVSTARDYLAFARMLRAGGRLPTGERLLSRPLVELLTQRPAERRAEGRRRLRPRRPGRALLGLRRRRVTRRTDHASVGTYGWSGGLGSLWANDPVEDLTCVLLTNRIWMSPVAPTVAADFLTTSYAAIDG